MLNTAPERGAHARRRRAAGVLSLLPRPTVPSRRPVARNASSREHVQAALECGRERERLALALILLERLTPAEAADSLGISVRCLVRTYHDTLARLRRISECERPTRVAGPRMRKAS